MAINSATTNGSAPSAAPLMRPVEIVTVIAVLAALIVTLQQLSGAYRGEFGDDEASHYISGLFLRDYFTTLPLQHPLSFLKEFHSRYPLVGIGHWPPLFYGVEAVWMMLFSSSKTAVMALAAAMTLATLAVMDWVGNAPHGVVLPYNYWSRAEWQSAFDNLGLKVDEIRTSLGLYAAPLSWFFERGLHSSRVCRHAKRPIR